eukprot:jgi/Psemu1/13772/gm1.13772_g
MPEPAVSWNEVRGIHFSFGHHFGCGNKQWKLNAAFAQMLPNIASLFIFDKDGVKTLRPDPIPVLKSLIVPAIVDELPASEVFKAHKQHIALLLSNSAIFCHKKDHVRFRVRDKRGLDKAARRANNGDQNIRLVLTIYSWEFHKDWYPYEFHKLKFNDKLIEQLKRKRNGETVQQVLPPKRKRPKTTRPVTGGLNPIKPIESEVEPTIQVPEQCTFESSNKTSPVIVPSGTTDLVHTKTIDPNNVETSLNSTALSNPHYTWTWTYSPNSELVSFRRIRSDSFLCATSSSPPVQRQEKSSIVTAPSVPPSALTRVGHYHVPPSPPSCIRLTLAEDTDLPNAASAYIGSLQSQCRNQLCSKPYYQPVLRLSKRHRDALTIQICFKPSLSLNYSYNARYDPSVMFACIAQVLRFVPLQHLPHLDLSPPFRPIPSCDDQLRLRRFLRHNNRISLAWRPLDTNTRAVSLKEETKEPNQGGGSTGFRDPAKTSKGKEAGRLSRKGRPGWHQLKGINIQSENTDLSLKTRMTRAKRLSLKYSVVKQNGRNGLRTSACKKEQIAKSICYERKRKSICYERKRKI